MDKNTSLNETHSEELCGLEKALQICDELKSQLNDDIGLIGAMTVQYNHIGYMKNIRMTPSKLCAYINHLQSHELGGYELIVDGHPESLAETRTEKNGSQTDRLDCDDLKSPLDTFEPMELQLSESVDLEVSHEIIESSKLAEAESTELPSYEPVIEASLAIETSTPNEENMESPRAGQLVWAQIFSYLFWPAIVYPEVEGISANGNLSSQIIFAKSSK